MRKYVHVEREIPLFGQSHGHGVPADVADHRLVDWEAGIGIDDFVAFIHQREDGKENDRLAAGDDNHFVRSDLYAARAAHFFCDGLAKIRNAGRWAIMRPAGVKRVNGGIHDVRRSIEIRLSDFEMDDFLALPLQRARPVQHFERSLGAQSRHALSQPQLELDGPGHRGKRTIVLPGEGLSILWGWDLTAF